MSKFKVGDRVLYGDNELVISRISKVFTGERFYYLREECGDIYAICSDERYMKLATPTSPIVEKTVKSVVPGVYGRVAVETTFLEKENRLTICLADSAGEYKQYDYGMIMTASELEAAAKTFMELAEYLKERE